MTTSSPLYWQHYSSPVGPLGLAVSSVGVRAVLWPDDMNDRARPAHGGRVQVGELSEQPPSPSSQAMMAQLIEELDAYFVGSSRRFTVPVDLVGTEHQVEVWNSLSEIGYARTVSYSDQAIRLGRPKAVRAIASANGKNPVSIVLPCHRVVGKDGSLTGFAGGLATKQWLLDHEARVARSITS